MRQYVNPLVALWMGVFMIAAASIYTIVVCHYVNQLHENTDFKLFLLIPSLIISLYGLLTMLYATLIIRGTITLPH